MFKQSSEEKKIRREGEKLRIIQKCSVHQFAEDFHEFGVLGLHFFFFPEGADFRCHLFS